LADAWDCEALRLVAIGPEAGLTGWCAEQCVLGTDIVLLDALAADDGRRRVEQAQRLVELRPDIVLFTGGMEGGDNAWLAPMLDLLLAVRGRLSPDIVYASNSQAVPLVVGLLGGDVLLLPNAYPEPDAEQFAPARAAPAALVTARQTEACPPAAFIRHSLECCGETPVPASPGSQLLVHLGGAATLIASRRGGAVSRTTSPFGLGKGLLAAAERLDTERLARLLGRPLDRVEWLDYCGNRSLAPTYPPSAPELPLLRVVAGELLYLTLTDHLLSFPEERPLLTNTRWWEKLGPPAPLTVRPAQIVAGGEWFSCLTSTPAQLITILLSGLQPEGISEVYHVANDQSSVRQSPTSAPAFPSSDGRLLATLVCPFGLPASGRVALAVQSRPGQQPLLVRSGEQVTLDLAKGTSQEVELQPAREVDLGAGAGRPIRRTVQGGVLGLVIDCRGRPLLPPPVHSSRRTAGAQSRLCKGGVVHD